MATNLWMEFNLGENNPDVGGGILYCLRYDSKILDHKRDYIISNLNSQHLKIKEHGECLEVIPPKDMRKSDIPRTVLLLEELSVLNDALDYASIGLDQYNSLFELKNGLITNYFDMLKPDQVGAYNLVDMFIPQVARELYIADKQNKILSSSERDELEQLVSFAENQVKHLNNPGGYMILGL